MPKIKSNLPAGIPGSWNIMWFLSFGCNKLWVCTKTYSTWGPWNKNLTTRSGSGITTLWVSNPNYIMCSLYRCFAFSYTQKKKCKVCGTTLCLLKNPSRILKLDRTWSKFLRRQCKDTSWHGQTKFKLSPLHERTRGESFKKTERKKRIGACFEIKLRANTHIALLHLLFVVNNSNKKHYYGRFYSILNLHLLKVNDFRPSS